MRPVKGQVLQLFIIITELYTHNNDFVTTFN